MLFAWLDCDETAARYWVTAQLQVVNEQFIPRIEDLITYSYSDTRQSHLSAHYLDFFVRAADVKKRLELVMLGDSKMSDRAKELLAIWQSESPGGLQRRQRTVEKLLLEWRWEFVFNPVLYSQTEGARGSKLMRFDTDGVIVEGGNDNEFRWRMSGEFFEFINSDGKLYSQFRLDPASKRFDHTNDPDTPSNRNQYMVAVEQRSHDVS